VVDGVVAAIGGYGDDFGFAGCSSLLVLDAVGFSGVVGAEFAGANDDFQVGCLVQTFRLTRADPGNYGFDCDGGVRACDRSSRWVVGAGGGGFDVRDVLAPVGEE